MAAELRLWAIGVDEFRQCFAAPEALKETLVQISDSLQPAEAKAQSRNLFSKFGPLMRHPESGAVIRPLIPNRHDAEAMMTGRFIDSDRLGACWVLTQAWLDHLALSHAVLDLTPAEMDTLEFDLVRAGVPTQLGIRHLWRHSLDIPLRPTQAMTIGYMAHDTVLQLTEQWTSALADLEEATVQFATSVLEFTSHFPQYAETRQAPVDLIAWWASR
ncbi:MAG: hypothetical protein FWF25_00870 [Propionibacteriaceae bacterium]|nr:hypothetical protein [Propionibacteriaceae bacterium]